MRESQELEKLRTIVASAQSRKGAEIRGSLQAWLARLRERGEQLQQSDAVLNQAPCRG